MERHALPVMTSGRYTWAIVRAGKGKGRYNNASSSFEPKILLYQVNIHIFTVQYCLYLQHASITSFFKPLPPIDILRLRISNINTLTSTPPLPSTLRIPYQITSPHLTSPHCTNSLYLARRVTMSTCRIAILNADTPVPNVLAERGQYSNIFATLLKSAAAQAQDLASLNLDFIAYDCVFGHYPTTAELDSIDAIIISGSCT